MLFDLNAGESASSFKTRMASLGNETKMSSEKMFSVAYSGNSLLMRQLQEQTIFEYRGLTLAAAEALVSLSAQNSARTIYYHAVGSDGDSVAVGLNVNSGESVDSEYVMARVGDSNAFTVTRTDTKWTASPVGSGWTTTRPTASGNGVETSRSGSSQMLTAYMVSGTVHTFNTTETVVVRQYKYRTKSEATTLVANNTSSNASYQSYGYGSSGFYAVALTGTIKSATMRYVDGDSQYTVEVVERTLGGAWA